MVRNPPPPGAQRRSASTLKDMAVRSAPSSRSAASRSRNAATCRERPSACILISCNSPRRSTTRSNVKRPFVGIIAATFLVGRRSAIRAPRFGSVSASAAGSATQVARSSRRGPGSAALGYGPHASGVLWSTIGGQRQIRHAAILPPIASGLRPRSFLVGATAATAELQRPRRACCRVWLARPAELPAEAAGHPAV